MQIEHSIKLDFDDVLIRPKRSTLDSRQIVNLTREFVTLNSKQHWDGIPIVAANMDTVGTIAMAKEIAKFSGITALHKHYSLNEVKEHTQMREYDKLSVNSYFVTVGINSVGTDIIKELSEFRKSKLPYKPMVNVDVANGYTSNFHNQVKEIRRLLPDSVIMAGNVATPEMVQQILECGADIVKIGIGPGSVCTTRIQTGCGYPQLSAIIECADAAHGYGGMVCADGGCKTPGDVAKAFGAGADFVMLGGMFAGCDECEGEWTYKTVDNTKDPPCVITNKKHKKLLRFYGMASRNAQVKYNGGIAEHGTAEGKCVEIPYKGPVSDVMKDILGGLRSACTYVGAKNLKDLTKCCTFIRCSNTHNRVFD